MSSIQAAASAMPLARSERSWRYAGSVCAWAGYLFLVLPSLIVIPISFNGTQELQFPPHQLSLHLYRDFFSERSWWHAAVQSLIVASLTSVLALSIALPAAYALARNLSRLARAAQVVLLAPMLVPVIVLGLGLYIELTHLRLTDTTAGIVFSHAVVVVPYAFVTLTAGLRQSDPALETVALLMGASRLRILRMVVLPQIRGAIIVACLFAFLLSFDEVVIAYFVTGPTTQTLPVKMYSAIRWQISPVIAAVATLLSLLSLGVCGLYFVLQKDSGAARRRSSDS